jgi:hypothetical protein
MKTKGSCAKCGVTKDLTFHHILPKCFWGRQGGRHGGGTICLCKFCHREIELIIQAKEKHSGFEIVNGRSKLPATEYIEILTKFLQ